MLIVFLSERVDLAHAGIEASSGVRCDIYDSSLRDMHAQVHTTGCCYAFFVKPPGNKRLERGYRSTIISCLKKILENPLIEKVCVCPSIVICPIAHSPASIALSASSTCLCVPYVLFRQPQPCCYLPLTGNILPPSCKFSLFLLGTFLPSSLFVCPPFTHELKPICPFSFLAPHTHVCAPPFPVPLWSHPLNLGKGKEMVISQSLQFWVVSW